ncbi:hypothetical protein ACLOJK_017037 [Asimina triloba]
MKLRRRMKLRMMGLHTSSHALSSIARESVDDGACGRDHLRRICRVEKSGKGSCVERQRLKPFAEDFVEGGERRREREEGEGDGRGRRTQEGEEDGRGRRIVPTEKVVDLNLLAGQDHDIADNAAAFCLYSLPNLLVHVFLQPIQVYLRSLGINKPMMYCAVAALIFGLGVPGVAIAAESDGVYIEVGSSMGCHCCHCHGVPGVPGVPGVGR